MIPEFPSFIKLRLNHVPEILKITQNFPEYSDYNPVSLLAWDIHEDTSVSNLHGNLVFMLRDYIDGSKSISFFGLNNISRSLKLLLNFAKCNDIEPIIRLVPEETIKLMRRGCKFNISSDRDNYDYIVRINDIALMQGKKFRRIRQQVNIFETENDRDIPVEELDLANEQHIQEITDVFMRREAEKSNNDEKAELQAMLRLVKISPYFNIVARGVRINGKLEAFIILEKSNFQLVGHFCKANFAYRGIYHYLLQNCCKEFSLEGYQYINLEQDLGIDGIRTAKEQLRPSYLRKYTIQPQVPQSVEQLLAFRQLSLEIHYD